VLKYPSMDPATGTVDGG